MRGRWPLSAGHLKRMIQKTAQAIKEFDMIVNGDRVMLCLSGGKDSWTMLYILKELQKKAPVNFDIFALHVFPGFWQYDFGLLRDTCKAMDVGLVIVESDIRRVVEENQNPGSSFCSFCARLRRGVIYAEAEKNGATKIALAHHRDDLIETLLLNQFYAGQMKSMAPCRTTDNGRYVVIRPMAYVAEEDIIVFSGEARFPIIESKCPFLNSGKPRRQKIKAMLSTLQKDDPTIKAHIMHAMKNLVVSHLLDARYR